MSEKCPRECHLCAPVWCRQKNAKGREMIMEEGKEVFIPIPIFKCNVHLNSYAEYLQDLG